MSRSMLTLSCQDPNARSMKVHELSTMLHAEWSAMSPEEQTTVTAEAMDELRGIREMKAVSMQNAPINALKDVREALGRLKDEVNTLVTDM